LPNEFRVRAVWDVGNAAQFSQSIKSTFASIKSAYRTSSAPSSASTGAPSLNLGRVTSQIDSYNNTLATSGQVFHRYVVGFEADLKKLAVAEARLGTAGKAFASPASLMNPAGLSSYGTSKTKTGRAQVSKADLIPIYDEIATGETTKRYANTRKIQAAQLALIPAEKEFLALEQKRVLGLAKYEAMAKTDMETLVALDKQRIRAQAQLNSMYTMYGGKAPVAPVGGIGPIMPAVLQPGKKDKGLKDLTDASGNRYFADDMAYAASIGRNKSQPLGDPTMQRALYQLRGLDNIEAQWNGLVTSTLGTKQALETTSKKAQAFAKRIDRLRTKLGARWAPQISALGAAKVSTPDIGTDLDQFLGQSKGFRKEFIQAMQMQNPYVAPATAKTGAADRARIEMQREAFSNELLSKGVNPDSVKAVYDYEKGVYRLSGTITDANGRQGQWNRTIDRFGNTIENNNGRLGRQSGFLKQTGRDFQKVIEWTVATTLVFGALGMAMGSISKINQANKDLAKFAITAKTTGAETKQAFQDIADIAYRTATPLTEMTDVMDDIALATRRAGQTSAEWRKAINSMAEAVGVLTNLTGVDTLKATDILSAAYKQLGVAPNQLIDVLNKVTAVAGGNAKAIEDIASALGSVSEAAKASGLTLDEQIASVQVLSQVTNKTSADVATAFKNLFGSISSAGSEKALAKFNIPIRDAEGQLRHFLDIYKDIYDAKKSGRISEGELQAVLKGIAGGPRRAPDAAALLEAMPLIYEQITKSTGATNEALIANARILTTNSAKLQQMRTLFDAALIQTFTDSVNKLVKVFTDLGGAFKGLSGDGTLFALITQFALISLGTLGFLKALTLLKGGLRGIRSELFTFGKMSQMTGTWLDKFSNPYRALSKSTLPYATSPISMIPATPAPSSMIPIRRGVVPKTTIPRPAPIVGPSLPPTPILPPSSRYVPRPRFIPYTPITRPTPPPLPTVPGIPSPVGNREWRRSPAGKAYAAAILRGQTPIPYPGTSVGMNPAAGGSPVGVINPAAGLIPLKQQLIDESKLKKIQAVSMASFLKERAAQISIYIKDRTLKEITDRKVQLASSLSTNKQILVGELGFAKQRLSAWSTYYKERLLQTVTSAKQQIAAEAKYRGSQLLGTGKGRALLGAGAGLAVGGAMAAAGSSGAVDIGTLSSVGQMAGVGMLFSGVAPIMAAGAAITGVSLLLSKFNEDQIKVKDAAAAARTALYDELGVMKEQQTILTEATKARDASLVTISKLSNVSKKSTEDTEKLSMASNTYLESLFSISGAQKQVEESTQRLISATSDLSDTYKELIISAKAQGFTPESLTKVSSELAAEILGQKSPGAKGFNFNKVAPTSRAIIGSTIPEGNNGAMSDAPIMSKSDFFDVVRGSTNQQLLDMLKNNSVPGAGIGGAELSADTAVMINYMLSGMIEQVKSGKINQDDFNRAVENFGRWTENLYAPQLQLSRNLAANDAVVQAQTALGMLSGEKAANATGRARIGADLQQYIDSGAIQKYVNRMNAPRDARDNYNADIYRPNRITVDSETTRLQNLLFGQGGKGGIIGGEGVPNTSLWNAEEAKSLFNEVMKLDPAFSTLAKNTDLYNIAVYKYFSKNGIEINALKNNIKDLSLVYAEEFAAIDEQVRSGKEGIAGDLLNLEAQRLGGEFTSTNTNAKKRAEEQAELNKVYSLTHEQLKELSTAYETLGSAVKIATATSDLEGFRQELSFIPELLGIQYTSVDQLVPALMNYARTLGLTGAQIAKFSQDIVILANNFGNLSKVRAVMKLSADPSQAIRVIKGLLSIMNSPIMKFLGISNIPKSVLGSMSTLNSALAGLQAEARIGDLLGLGAGTNFAGANNKSGGGGGGGGGSNKPGLLDIPEEFKTDPNRTVSELIAVSIKNAKDLQSKIPGETKANRNAVVAILDGTKKLKETKGIGEEYLRRAMEELTAEIKKQNDLLLKTDKISQIRVGAGSFAAIANVPTSAMGISTGGPGQPVNVNLNVNGQILTPAQLDQLANLIAAQIKAGMA
jgi:TP901 family phage tail tape measure protein